MKPRLVIEWTLRIGLGGLFVYAGGAKLPDLEGFFWDVHHFELTSPDVSLVAAFLIPWLEVFSGLALLTGRLYLGGIAICGALSSAFFGAIASAWYRGLDITCGCFGKEQNATNFPKHITLDTAMLVAAITLWILASRRQRPQPESVEA